MKFDTGLDMEMYQECYIIALDEFKKSEYYLSNDIGNNTRKNVNAWLSLLVTDDIEKIDRNIEKYPWLEEIYIEMAEYLVKPEEVFNMYSEALRILDENTVKYMVDELKGENEELRVENTELSNKVLAFQKKQNEKEKELIKNMYILFAERTSKLGYDDLRKSCIWLFDFYGILQFLFVQPHILILQSSSFPQILSRHVGAVFPRPWPLDPAPAVIGCTAVDGQRTILGFIFYICFFQ